MSGTDRQIVVAAVPNRLAARLDDLLADYKARGMNAHAAYNQLIRDRALRPDIGMIELAKRYPAVVPRLMTSSESVSFKPTHRDTLLDRDVQIEATPWGGFAFVWEHGMSGSAPTLDVDRFVVKEST